MRAQYAASRLAIVKVDLPKGTGGLTGHHHASPSHDSAAHTGGWRRPLLRSVGRVRREPGRGDENTVLTAVFYINKQRALE